MFNLWNKSNNTTNTNNTDKENEKNDSFEGYTNIETVIGGSDKEIICEEFIIIEDNKDTINKKDDNNEPEEQTINSGDTKDTELQYVSHLKSSLSKEPINITKDDPINEEELKDKNNNDLQYIFFMTESITKEVDTNNEMNGDEDNEYITEPIDNNHDMPTYIENIPVERDIVELPMEQCIEEVHIEEDIEELPIEEDIEEDTEKYSIGEEDTEEYPIVEDDEEDIEEYIEELLEEDNEDDNEELLTNDSNDNEILTTDITIEELDKLINELDKDIIREDNESDDSIKNTILDGSSNNITKLTSPYDNLIRCYQESKDEDKDFDWNDCEDEEIVNDKDTDNDNFIIVGDDTYIEEANIRNVLLLGPTGVGKSTFGNYMAQKILFMTSDDEDSCTKDINVKSFKILVDGTVYQINIIDTPGCCDTNGKDMTTIIDLIHEVKTLGKIHKLYLFRSAQNARINEKEREVFGYYNEIFGSNIWNNSSLIMTQFYNDISSKMRIKSKYGSVNKFKKSRENRSKTILNFKQGTWFVDSEADIYNDKDNREIRKAIIDDIIKNTCILAKNIKLRKTKFMKKYDKNRLGSLQSRLLFLEDSRQKLSNHFNSNDKDLDFNKREKRRLEQSLLEIESRLNEIDTTDMQQIGYGRDDPGTTLFGIGNAGYVKITTTMDIKECKFFKRTNNDWLCKGYSDRSAYAKARNNWMDNSDYIEITAYTYSNIYFQEEIKELKLERKMKTDELNIVINKIENLERETKIPNKFNEIVEEIQVLEKDIKRCKNDTCTIDYFEELSRIVC